MQVLVVDTKVPIFSKYVREWRVATVIRNKSKAIASGYESTKKLHVPAAVAGGDKSFDPEKIKVLAAIAVGPPSIQIFIRMCGKGGCSLQF